MASAGHGDPPGVLRVGGSGAEDPEGQRVGPANGPVPGRTEFPPGLAVERRPDVVVLERHRLLAFVDDHPLGERRLHVADERSAALVGPAVDPGVVDAVIVVVVVFHVVHGQVLAGRKAPGVALPDRWRPRLVDLDHLPEVRRPEHQGPRIEAVLHQGLHGHRPAGDSLAIVAEVDFVENDFPPGLPTEEIVDRRIDAVLSRPRIAGVHRDLEEPHLAQPVASQDAAPVAVDGQSDVSCGHSAQKDRLAGVRIDAVRLLQDEAAQPGPHFLVGGVRDDHIFGPEPDPRLQVRIEVPHLHPVELADGVELELNPGRLEADPAAEPHVGRLGRMPVAVETRAVDGVFGSHAGRLAGRRGLDGRNRTGVRLDGERPDLAGKRRVAGCRVHLIHSPVVCPAVLQRACWIVLRSVLVLADQNAPGIGSTGDLHVRRRGPQVDIVGPRPFARRPGENHVAKDIVGSILGADRPGRRRPSEQFPDLRRRERPIVDSRLVEHSGEAPTRSGGSVVGKIGDWVNIRKTRVASDLDRHAVEVEDVRALVPCHREMAPGLQVQFHDIHRSHVRIAESDVQQRAAGVHVQLDPIGELPLARVAEEVSCPGGLRIGEVRPERRRAAGGGHACGRKLQAGGPVQAAAAQGSAVAALHPGQSRPDQSPMTVVPGGIEGDCPVVVIQFEADDQSVLHRAPHRRSRAGEEPQGTDQGQRARAAWFEPPSRRVFGPRRPPGRTCNNRTDPPTRPTSAASGQHHRYASCPCFSPSCPSDVTKRAAPPPMPREHRLHADSAPRDTSKRANNDTEN